MNTEMPKKMIIPCIIEVLKKYTDEDHTFTQREIAEKLESDWGMKIDRKTLSRNLKNLMLYDDEERIQYRVKKRNGEDLSIDEDDEGAVYTDFYYSHMFEKSEIRVLIYNVIFSKHISYRHKKDLVEKIESLGPFSVRHNMKYYIREDKESAKDYGELFWHLDQLNVAIESKKVVEFQYASYEEDMKLHVDERMWKVFPLGIAEKNNDFYLVGLICGSRKESTSDFIRDIEKMIEDSERGTRFLDTFRIDRLRNLTITENEELSENEKKLAKQMSLQTFKKEWGNILDYASQNSSLSPGRAITAKFKMEKGLDGDISDAIDYFGKENIRIQKVKVEIPESGKNLKKSSEDDSTSYICTVKTNDRAMMEFAKSYAREVEVLEPDYLREDMMNLFKSAYEKMAGC